MSNHRLYYFLKPLIPRLMQIQLRRKYIKQKMKLHDDIWPVDPASAKPPKNWKGWPGGKQFSLVLTHDVESAIGQERCMEIMYSEKMLGFKSSFNFVPERYQVWPDLRYELTQNGFEVGVHGLNHDGKLYSSKDIFNRRVHKINKYLLDWGSVGFRSPAMHHNLDWLGSLNIEYDASTFDTDPFEPQSDGVATIFPFWVNRKGTKNGYVEIPYTLPQDFTLFVVMRYCDSTIWKQKLAWIAKQGGMALLNTHPDYMAFNGRKPGVQEFPVEYYTEFLMYIKTEYEGRFWQPLPRELARFWRKNYSGDCHSSVEKPNKFNS